MNSSSQQAAPKVEVVQETAPLSSGVASALGVLAIIPLIFTFLFHAGAAYMSYQRNQSFGWAILHFFLAVFYYPYYAFTQAGKPVETPMESSSSLLPTVQSAGRKVKKLLTKRK